MDLQPGSRKPRTGLGETPLFRGAPPTFVNEFLRTHRSPDEAPDYADTALPEDNADYSAKRSRTNFLNVRRSYRCDGADKTLTRPMAHLQNGRRNFRGCGR